MGAIEDFRQVIQDLVTPDLKAIAARLEMLEKRMDRLDIRMDRLESRMESGFERVERNAEARMNQLFIALGHERRIKQLEEEHHQEKQ